MERHSIARSTATDISSLQLHLRIYDFRTKPSATSSNLRLQNKAFSYIFDFTSQHKSKKKASSTMAVSTVKGSFEIKTSHIFHETAINEHLSKQYELKLFRWNDNVSECNSKWKVGLTTTNVSKIDGTVVDKKIESDFGISASNFEKVTTIFKQLRNFVEREVQETYNSGTVASTFDSYHNHLMERLKI